MAPTHATTVEADGDVMGAIDEESDGKRFVVADVNRDDAWAAVALSDAASLEVWR